MLDPALRPKCHQTRRSPVEFTPHLALSQMFCSLSPRKWNKRQPTCPTTKHPQTRNAVLSFEDLNESHECIIQSACAHAQETEHRGRRQPHTHDSTSNTCADARETVQQTGWNKTLQEHVCSCPTFLHLDSSFGVRDVLLWNT